MNGSVAIVGGGLAGMTAALRLLERGVHVTLIEATHRLGGKAGADQHGAGWDEHGWHLFPLWYLNIWHLADELEIRNHFVDRTRYAYMRPGAYPQTVYLENPFSWRTALHNIFNGVLPPPEALLYQYVLLDLMSQPVRVRARLDQVTVNGFARSRFYCTDSVVDQLEDTVSRASAIESYEMSAMTVRNVMRYWFKYHDPWFRVLNGDLQTRFIAPFENKLRALGCVIRTNCIVESVVTEGRKARALCIRAAGAEILETVPVDNLLVAVAAEDFRLLITPSLQAAAPTLGGLFYLRSRVMAGMTIRMKHRVSGIPAGHVNFTDTPYELSIIDVTELWGFDKTVLCVVCSDYTTLQAHSPEQGREILVAELQRYLPFLRGDNVEAIDFQPHVEHPLFANTAGAWPYRPKSQTELENLFVAGDYCQSAVDLTCMEGAVSTGLQAAEALRQRLGLEREISVLVPDVHPRAYLVLLKLLLLPVAIGALLWTKVRSLLGSRVSSTAQDGAKDRGAV